MQQQCRALFAGVVGDKLNWSPYGLDRLLQDVPNKPLSKTSPKFEKDKYYRDLRAAQDDIGNLFGDTEKNDLLRSAAAARDSLSSGSSSSTASSGNHRSDDMSRMSQQGKVNEALRVYRALRPDAPPFYEEEAMARMEAQVNKMSLNTVCRNEDDRNRILGAGNDADSVADETDINDDVSANSSLVLSNLSSTTGDSSSVATMPGGRASKIVDPFQSYLPSIDTKSYILALHCITQSLCDDLELIAEKVLRCISAEEVQRLREDPLRFQVLVEKILNAFQLQRDPSKVEDFLCENWDGKLELLIGPGTALNLEREEVKEYLQGHLERVNYNRANCKRIRMHQGQAAGALNDLSLDGYYSFAEDFIYDSYPMSPSLVDERNLDFPLHKMGEQLSLVLSTLFGVEPEEAEKQGEDFQNVCWDLEKIGLRMFLCECHSCVRFSILLYLLQGTG